MVIIMGAKEMFKELGFERTESNGFISYENGDTKIAFDRIEKGICAYDFYGNVKWIEFEWFNAIKQQMIEMGWI